MLALEEALMLGSVRQQEPTEAAESLAVQPQVETVGQTTAQEVSKSDWEQAKRELTGDSNTDPNAAVLESAPESERWDPVPGSTGHKVPVASGEDEDDEGRSDNERLVEEGIAGAEHDQMRKATKAAARKDNGGT